MPKPDNIVLRNLTGGPTLGPPVKGATSPKISTVLVQRDGSRDTGGGENPPVQNPGDDPRYVNDTYPPSNPGGTGPGTNDPLFSFDKIEYLGAFCLPGNAQREYDREIMSIGFNPPNGSNGSFGSLMAAYQSDNFTNDTIGDVNGGGSPLFEFQIPDTLNTGDDHFLFEDAALLRGPLSVHGGFSTQVDDAANSDRVGFMGVVNNKMIISVYRYYSSAPALNNLLIIDDPVNWDQSTVTGWSQLKPENKNDDKASLYFTKIPTTKQSLFGGNDYLSGSCVTMGLMGRGSYGPSLYSWNSNQIFSGATVVNTTEHAWWEPSSNPKFHRQDNENTPARNAFETITGLNYDCWIMVPPGSTTPDSENRSTVTNELRQIVAHDGTSSGAGFADSNTATTTKAGVYWDTLVIKNEAKTITYVEGVDYTLKASTERSGWPANWGLNDPRGVTIIQMVNGGGLTLGDMLSLEYDYLTIRPDDVTDYLAPDKANLNQTINDLTTCKFCLFVPNTDTILFIYKNAAMNYGVSYKMPNPQTYPNNASGGWLAADARDFYDYYMLYNVNDVVSAATPQDVVPYEYGVFDNNRFVDKSFSYYRLNQGLETSKVGDDLRGGCYDPSTKRMYIVKNNMQKTATSSEFQFSKQIVSVYQVNT